MDKNGLKPGLQGSVIERFRRVTTGSGYIPEIDGLRFIAIMAVLLNHIAGITVDHSNIVYALHGIESGAYALLRQGRFGVQLFFVISGFILAMPFLRANLYGGRKVSLRHYFLRRLTRLEPPYILIIILYFFLLVALGQYEMGELWPHFLASLFYLHNIIYGEPSWVNGVAWSLEIEVQFYLLLPVLILLVGLANTWLRRSLLVTLIVSLVGWRSALGDTATIVRYLHFFLLGFLMADLYLAGFLKVKSICFDALLLVSALGMGFYFFAQPFPVKKDLLVMALFAILFTAAFRGRLTSSLLSSPYISVIGGMCYSIYLLHAQIIGFFVRFISKGKTLGLGFWFDFSALALCLVPVILAASAMFFFFIERPCMYADWPQRLSGWAKNKFHQNFLPTGR